MLAQNFYLLIFKGYFYIWTLQFSSNQNAKRKKKSNLGSPNIECVIFFNSLEISVNIIYFTLGRKIYSEYTPDCNDVVISKSKSKNPC